MSNFRYVGTVGGVSPEAMECDVAAGTAGSILTGDLVNLANGYAVLVANGGGVNTGTNLFGLATTTSTETAGVAGKVSIMYCPSGLVCEGVATTPANLSIANVFDLVTIDLSGTTMTVDENDVTNAAIRIMKLVGTDYATTGKVQVIVPFRNP
jgi:hypothetical protein